MANKRMFSKQITESDAFLDMPVSSQLLYFHLNMGADDDGFVANPKRIMRMLAVGDDDLKVLLAKRFLLKFESGVVVIKHWLLHNAVRKDMYCETQYLEEKKMLQIKDNNVYTELRNETVTKPLHRLDKVRIEKDRLDQVRLGDGEQGSPHTQEEKINIIKKKTEDFVFSLKELCNGKMLKREQIDELRNFVAYWTEPNKSQTKLRWEMEKTWDTGRRLDRWLNNNNKFRSANKKPRVANIPNE